MHTTYHHKLTEAGFAYSTALPDAESYSLYRGDWQLCLDRGFTDSGDWHLEALYLPDDTADNSDLCERYRAGQEADAAQGALELLAQLSPCRACGRQNRPGRTELHNGDCWLLPPPGFNDTDAQLAAWEKLSDDEKRQLTAWTYGD